MTEAWLDQAAECAACADKPGSPKLCVACRHNRDLVGRLHGMIDTERAIGSLHHKNATAAEGALDSMRKQLEAAAHDAACLESRLRGMFGSIRSMLQASSGRMVP